MKRKWQKGLAAALSVMMAVGAAGCGSEADTGKTAEGTAPQTAESAVQDKAAGESELDVVKVLGRNYTYTGANGQTVTLRDWSSQGKSKRWQMLEERLAEKGVKLELELIEPDQFDTTIQTMAASGELSNYDLVNITPLDNKTRINLVNQGQLQSISDIWEQYSEGAFKDFIASDAGQFYYKHIMLEDGKCYWLTDFETNNYKGEVDASPTLGFQLRQDWLDELGLEMPKTLDDLYNTLKAFQEKDVNHNGQADEAVVVNYSTFATDIAQWFGLGINTTFVNSQNGNKVESPWYQEHVKEYIQYMQKLYADGLLKMADNQFGTYLANNQVAAVADWAAELWLEPQVTVPENAAYPWFAPVRIEAVEGQTPLYRGANPYNPGWTATAVPASSDKQEAIAKVLDYIVTEEAINLTEYGIEGVSCELVDGKFNNIIDASLENTDAVGMALWCNGAIFPRYKLNNDISGEMEATIAFANTNGVKNNSSAKFDFVKACIDDLDHRLAHDENGYAIPTVEEIDRINDISTDLNTYSSELLTKLIMGEKSLDDWDSYISDLQELGLDEMIAINQARWDRANQE